jgi:hypothetical protein
MSDLVFIAFENEKKAEEVRDKILGMQKEYLIEVSDAVIATRDENGRVKLNQLMHPAAAGAVSGAFSGMLIGWLFLMPVAGAAVGAASGALGGSLVDVGINDQEMKTQGQRGVEARHGRPLSSHSQDDDRQGSRGPEGDRRSRYSHVLRPRERRCAERSFGRSRPDGIREDRLILPYCRRT